MRLTTFLWQSETIEMEGTKSGGIEMLAGLIVKCTCFLERICVKTVSKTPPYLQSAS